MSYNYSERFCAAISAPTTLNEKITLEGTGYSSDATFVLTSEYFSKVDNKMTQMVLNFDILDNAFSYIDAYRNLAANIVNTPPLPYRVEIAGIDKDGEITNNHSFIITKNEGEALPYRLQMYRSGIPCDTYTDFRDVMDAVWEARELNSLEVGSIYRDVQYENGLSQLFYTNEDIDINQAAYISTMAQKDENGAYIDIPQTRKYHFSMHDVENEIERQKTIYTPQRNISAEVSNVLVAQNDDTRSITLEADVHFPNGTTVPFVEEFCFDTLVDEDLNRFLNEAASLGLKTTGNALCADLYNLHKDDMYYSNAIYHRLVNNFEYRVIRYEHHGYILSPTAKSQIWKHNPSRQTHDVCEDKQRTVKKDRSGEER